MLTRADGYPLHTPGEVAMGWMAAQNREMRVASIALIASLLGCSGPGSDASAGQKDFDAAAVPATYEKGSVFPDLELVGYLDRNGNEKLTPEEHGAFRVSDVVAGSPEFLLVHVAFGWCEWCWEEAKEQIRWYRGYGGRLRVLQVYVDDLRGVRADRSDVDFWIEHNASFLPVGVEPKETLFAKFGKNATYLLIDVKNGRTILDVGAGPPAFRRIEGILTEKLGALPPA